MYAFINSIKFSCVNQIQGSSFDLVLSHNRVYVPMSTMEGQVLVGFEIKYNATIINMLLG